MSLTQRALAVLALVIAALLYFTWGTMVQWTTDDETNPIVLWLYANDAAPGDELSGRLRAETQRHRIDLSSASVSGPGLGLDQVTLAGAASEELAFTVHIPDTAAPGEPLVLTISVNHIGTVLVSNEPATTTFHAIVPVYSKATSLLRRGGRAALAIASWFAVVIVLLRVMRWWARRDITPSNAWLLVLLPYALLGYVWFVSLLGQALRIQGWAFSAAGMAVWLAAIVVVEVRARRFGNKRYVVAQAQLASGTAEAYRAADVEVRTATPSQLARCLGATGFATTLAEGELVIRPAKRAEAIMKIPASGAFGAGEPFEIASRDRDLVIDLVTMATAELGDLTWSEGGRGSAFTVRRKAA
ncbi:MAG: hypothetical protein ABI867_35000 [Kofleriaceae bacterium]